MTGDIASAPNDAREGEAISGLPAEQVASAHNYRRSYGERWAKVVMPAVLQRMMQHQSIQTTMRYYATGDKLALAPSI